MSTELIRHEMARLVRQVPFRPFIITLKNGTPILINQAENIAFDAGEIGVRPGSQDFYVITGQMHHCGTFDSVTSVTLRDVNGLANSNGASSPPPSS